MTRYKIASSAPSAPPRNDDPHSPILPFSPSPFHNSFGFTLIELLVAISLTVIILGVVHFGLSAALESWQFTRDELALQQVLNSVMVGIQEGAQSGPGLRSALEITRADAAELGFVVPWAEEQEVGDPRGSFQLSRYLKPGTGLPTAEMRLPETVIFHPIPIYRDDPDNFTDKPRLRAGLDLVSGGTVRFSYHPDPERVPEAVVTLRYDEEKQAVYRERMGTPEEVQTNPFGVVITGCRFRYYDQTNADISDDVEANGRSPLQLVTAVGMEIEGKLGSHTLTLPGMVMLRNSPRQSGLLILKEGMRIPVPDSKHIKTLLLANITGVNHEDEIQLEFRPRAGRSWRVTARFERYGEARPVIAQVTVEYPPGHVIFTDRPRTGADLGLDLLTLGPSGLYDYDDDPGIEDAVMVEGDVMLLVTKLDVKGAACFVQP